MKNPLKYLKHIVKDPITTIAEADVRKKEIMPLFYGSIGVLALGLILQVAAKLDFMAAFSFVGLVGVVFCVFLFSVINSAKKRFEALTCSSCNTIAEIKTPEDFAKYISYTVEKDEAVFKGYSGNKEPTNGVYSLVKFYGSSKAVVSVQLTCPHCGEVKRLRYSAEPFKCYAEATKVGALQFSAVSSSLETSVRTAITDYNNPDKKKLIPYTFHSSKNPNFENRYSFKGSNGAGAIPNYMGARINYHKDVEEMLEHYFILNELNGTLSDPNQPSNKNKSNSKKKDSFTNSPKEDMMSEKEIQISQNDYEADEREKEQPVLKKAENESSINSDVKIDETKCVTIPVDTNTKAVLEKPMPIVEPKVENVKMKNSSKKNFTRLIVIALVICALLILGGLFYYIFGVNRGAKENNSGTAQSSMLVDNSSSDVVEKINVNDYVGYWHIRGNRDKELTIHSGNSESVNFSLWYYKGNEIKNISAQLQNNVGDFSLAYDGTIIKGTLTFHKDAITFKITQSTIMSMPAETMEFTLQDMTTWAQSDEYNNYQETKTPLNDVPYLFTAKSESYDIYKEPSFESGYVYVLPIGTYTIVAEEYDEYNNLWGKLKSGVGWICIG